MYRLTSYGYSEAAKKFKKYEQGKLISLKPGPETPKTDIMPEQVPEPTVTIQQDPADIDPITTRFNKAIEDMKKIGYNSKQIQTVCLLELEKIINREMVRIEKKKEYEELRKKLTELGKELGME